MPFKANTTIFILFICLLFSCSKDNEPGIDPSLALPKDITFFSTWPDGGQSDALFQVDLIGSKENIITSNLTAELNVTRAFDRYRNGNEFVFWNYEGDVGFKNMVSNESVDVTVFCGYVPNRSFWNFISTEDYIIAAEATEEGSLIIHRSNKLLDASSCTSTVVAEDIFRFGSFWSGSFLLSRGNQVVFSFARNEEEHSLYTYNVGNNTIVRSVPVTKDFKVASNGTSVFVFHTDNTFERYNFNLSMEGSGIFDYALVEGMGAKIHENKILTTQNLPAAAGFTSVPAIYSLDQNELISGELGLNMYRVLAEIRPSGILMSHAIDLEHEIIILGYQLKEPVSNPNGVLPKVARIFYVDYEGRILQTVDTELIPDQIIIR